ncbi:DUF4142 domain-containing protein [Shinella curvata]|uniref:DUF4142 domain-containing protein n=1 Tax=Shinella curvata TaxID=1817964 RepID=A0ABT8XLA8_9HYPH|nr:DUF4142 domain-containing protein [Shinella curvata]MCJ8056898.1 DUF4142 domain-containing protein [Shinella curvata]MDO6124233.1 DUF4142 domain-containing protein [Shinella curvata]
MQYRTFSRVTSHAIGFAVCIWTSSALAEPAAQFVDAAASLNQFLIQSGTLAQSRATKPATRTYANETVEIIAAAEKELKAAAEAEKAAVSPSLPAEQAQGLKALQEAPAADFDAAYMSAQMTTHAEIKKLYLTFIQDGIAGKVRAYAEKTYPELHMLEVRALSLASPATLTDGEQ